MKVIWITNILFAHHREMMGMKYEANGTGSWLYAAYEGSKDNTGIELHIVSSDNVNEIKVSKKDGVCFYVIPGGGSLQIDISSNANKICVQSLVDSIRPDVAIIWGTESHLAYLFMKALCNTPKAIFVQGLMNSIYWHYYDGIPQKYINATPRDIIEYVNPLSRINELKKQSKLENDMMQMALAIIIENEWSEFVCKSMNPKLMVIKSFLPIRDIFFRNEWSINKMKRHSIFTNAGGYPIKGHHILFKALGIVKKQFPDFKCYVPGESLYVFRNVKRRTGYTKYLEDCITEYGLQENVIYTGVLSQEQYIEHIITCNVYVMPSIIENHSSSLIEAMISGAPSVTSFVGGVSEFTRHKVNALVYNSTDAESLAGNIISIFSSDELAQSLSKEALKLRDIRKHSFASEMNTIYKRLSAVK